MRISKLRNISTRTVPLTLTSTVNVLRLSGTMKPSRSSTERAIVTRIRKKERLLPSRLKPVGSVLMFRRKTQTTRRLLTSMQMVLLTQMKMANVLRSSGTTMPNQADSNAPTVSRQKPVPSSTTRLRRDVSLLRYRRRMQTVRLKLLWQKKVLNMRTSTVLAKNLLGTTKSNVKHSIRKVVLPGSSVLRMNTW